MEKMNFSDHLSIVKESDNPNFIDNLKKELKMNGVDLSILNKYSGEEVLPNSFYFTYNLLSLFLKPIIKYNFIDDVNFYYALQTHCLISSLYTCKYLASQQLEPLKKNLLTNIAKEHPRAERKADGCDPSNAIKRFDKLQDTNFKFLINSHITQTLKSKRRYLQNFFVNEFFEVFDLSISNSSYMKMTKNISKECIKAPHNFFTTYRSGIDKLFSDYSTLFNFEIPSRDKNDNENNNDNKIRDNIDYLLLFYKLENIFHVSFLIENYHNFLNRKTSAQRLQLLAKLPNVFSRSSWDILFPNDEDIIYLSTFLIPLFEKTFFTILYTNIKTNPTDEVSTLNALSVKIIKLLQCLQNPNKEKNQSLLEDLDNIIKGNCFYKTNSNNSRIKNNYKNAIKTSSFPFARDFSFLLKSLYNDELKKPEYSFPEFSVPTLISFYYTYYNKFYLRINSKKEYDESIPVYKHLSAYFSEYVNTFAISFSTNYDHEIYYRKFIALSKVVMILPKEDKSPNSSENKIYNKINLFLCDLIYCSELLKGIPEDDTSFITEFIPLFNSAFDFIYNYDDYNRHYECNLISAPIYEEISFSTSIQDSIYYFMYIIFNSKVENYMYYKISDNSISHSLNKKAKKLASFIKKLEKELKTIYP